MMKLLPFVSGVVTLECADAKMWNDDGDNHSNETFRIFLWIARIKRLSLIAFMLLSVLLYYIPESRSHVRKACCFLIDLVADGLKFTLRATESDYGKKMKFKRRTFLNEQKNHSRRRNSEKNKTNERLSRCQENTRTHSRGYIRGLEGKYLNHHRDHHRRYREMIANDVTLKACLELAPFLQNQYQQKCDMYSVRLKKKNDQMVDDAFNHRNDVSYSKQKFVVGYSEDCEPNDSNLSINYYESSNDRFDQNVPEISTYQGEIVGDNQFFMDKNKRSMEDIKGDTICKRKILGIRQMHGDTIPEMSYNESSSTSLEVEADDENSQCGNGNEEKGIKFSKKRNVEETMTMSTSMGGYHSSSSNEILFPSRIQRKRRSFL